MTAGYSGKPLPEKLGVKTGMNALFQGAPSEIVEPWRAEFGLACDGEPPIDFAMVFVDRRSELEAFLTRARPLLRQNGMIWVCWPKKSSRVPSDIVEDTIREVAFPLDLVDVKVCAVSEIWSGLKLVIRTDKRVMSASD